MSDKHKIIIDTDPGIDDAMAIHLAFADPQIEVVGLTCIFGNVNQEQATRNALWLAESAHYHCDVASGASQPLVQAPNEPSYYVHGDEGFGDLGAQTPVGAAHELDAADYIIHMCRSHPGEITLCPVGPLTNIAIALQRDPDLVKVVKSVVIMGGAAFVPGNVTAFAEANIWNDPHAAEIVFAADWEVVMIGLDVTSQVTCSEDDYKLIADGSPKIGQFILDISQFYTRFYHSVLGEEVCVLHDPSAIIAITNPELFDYRHEPIAVLCDGEEIGQTVPDSSLSRTPTKIAVGVNVEKVKGLYLSRSAKADASKARRSQ